MTKASSFVFLTDARNFAAHVFGAAKPQNIARKEDTFSHRENGHDYYDKITSL